MHKLFIIVAATLLCSCATVMSYAAETQIQAAWSGQPEGARAAFIRCMYEISKSQCGTSDVKNPAVQKCMHDQVAEYRRYDTKGRWLMNKGCDRKRAELRKGEI